MILLLSEQNDISTFKVIKWLRYFGVPYVRWNKEDLIKIDIVSILKNNHSEIKISINEKKTDL
jgi:hypothetical protein